MRAILAAAVFACAAANADAQSQSYPSKPIRIVVPNAPGGGSDLVARVAAEKLSRSFGRQVIVENREGAASQIGTELVVRSPLIGNEIAKWLRVIRNAQIGRE